MQQRIYFKHFSICPLLVAALFFSLGYSIPVKATAAEKTHEQNNKSTLTLTPEEKEKLSKEVGMMRDLYVDCLTAANYARYHWSEKLFSAEEGDKICGNIADKTRSFLELMKYSGSEVEDFFHEAKQRAEKMWKEKFPELKDKKKETNPPAVQQSKI